MFCQTLQLYLRNSVVVARTIHSGPAGQGEFLKALGIEHRLGALLQQLDENNEKEQKLMYDLIMAYERLTEPEEMGELYKVLAIKNDNIGSVPGF